MGVTLERVQFKFASIIGELCSEPDILSQFAVWVDLRLAEYKLKGSISLDCSGDTPDPVWLKGILTALFSKRLAKQKLKATAQIQRIPTPTNTPRTNVRKTPHGVKYPRHIEDQQTVSLSPEPVIKQEPNDEDVFPVGIHATETDSVGNGAKSEDRKRSAMDYSSSPSHKERRVDDTSVDVEPSNESLMSIIGGDDSELTVDQADLSSFDNNSGADYNVSAEMTEQAQKRIEAAMLQGEGYVGPGELISTAGTSDSTFSAGTPRRWTKATGKTKTEFIQSISISPALVKKESGSGSKNSPKAGQISGTMSASERSSRKAQSNFVSAGGKFERWFKSENEDDPRHVEDLTPAELDTILVKFFSTITKGTGENYTPEAFRSLRFNLNQYLKMKGYPLCICKSELFLNSQMAYQRRIPELIKTHIIYL